MVFRLVNGHIPICLGSRDHPAISGLDIGQHLPQTSLRGRVQLQLLAALKGLHPSKGEEVLKQLSLGWSTSFGWYDDLMVI